MQLGYCRDLHHADKKQDNNSLAKPLQSILQEVEGNPVVKTKVLHLFRYAECNHLSLTGTTGLHEVIIANCLYWDAHRKDSGVILLARSWHGVASDMGSLDQRYILRHH